jgi:hypothetical protein
MRREEAEALCARLASTHPDRETHAWLPRRVCTDEWSVLKVKCAHPRSVARLVTSTEARARPEAADPRPSLWRDVGGPWAVG